MANGERPRPFWAPQGPFQPVDPGLYRHPGERMVEDYRKRSDKYKSPKSPSRRK